MYLPQNRNPAALLLSQIHFSRSPSVAHVEYTASPDGATLLLKRLRIANWHINHKTMNALSQAMSSAFSLQVVKCVMMTMMIIGVKLILTMQSLMMQPLNILLDL